MKTSTVNAIPKMTWSNAPSGVASASRERDPAWYAFDGNDGTGWWSDLTLPQQINYEFPSQKMIGAYALVAGQYYYPTAWQFQGTNDGTVWTTLDTQSNQNIINKKIKYFVAKPMLFKKYRLNITAGQYGTSNATLNTFEMFETIYDTKSLIKANNQYMYFMNGVWNVVGSTAIDTDYISYGHDDISIIPESAWEQLKGDVELCYWTDDQSKTEVKFNIETEPFTLEDEFAGQEIKVIEYTDNPSQTESAITLETEPFTLYDELGDEVDVLYYTDDTAKTSAELGLNAEYSPLDEIDGDFEIVTWTDDDEVDEVTINMNALPMEQILISQDDFNLYGDLKNIIVNKIKPGGTIKMLFSFDGGYSWESCKYNKWTQVDINNRNSVIANSMSVHDMEKLTAKQLNEKEYQFRIAYYIDESEHIAEQIIVDNIRVITNSPVEDVKFINAAFYLLNTLATINVKVAGNKLTGNLDDVDKGKVQYRVILNGSPYYPQNGTFTSLAPSPLDIQLNISERDIIFGVDNTLKVEFRDAWGQTDFWETKFVGTYSGLMFMDENKQYYSDTFGGVLKYLDFDVIIAGQTTIDQKVIVKNQLGERVQNLLLEVQKDTLPQNVEIQMSYTSSPFVPEDFILFNKFIEPDEENVFYVRIATDISATPNPNGQFEIRAHVDPV